MRRGRALLVMVAVACSTPHVDMTIEVPADAVPNTAWIEIGAFPNGVCPSSAQLAAGLPPSGLAARSAYAADAAAVGLGDLDTARYGFAAIARGDDCAVLAAGCTIADVSSSRSIDISLADTTGDPTAAICGAGLVCQEARCVPPIGGNDPNAGAGCSMVLVGAGPLPDALEGGPLVTAPAIVATPTGDFVIAYAEYLIDDGTTRLTIQPIDSSGGALAPNQQTLDGHCAGETSIDAAALVATASGFLAVVSRPTCMGQSGFEQFPLDSSANVLKRNVFLSAAHPTIALSTHALANAANASLSLLAANVSGDAVLDNTDGAKVNVQVTTTFGTPSDTAARVVRTSSVLAVEADGPSVGDAGIGGTVARIYLANAASDPTALGSPVEQTPIAISALTALAGRAYLITNGAGKGEDVAFRGYDLGASMQPAVSGGFSAIKSSTLLALDAAAAQNRLFAALEQQDSISIAVVDAAGSLSPQILRRVDLASDIRIPKSAHDGPIAIAATDSRVAIVWVAHAGALDDGEGVGGYAVFACKP